MVFTAAYWPLNVTRKKLKPTDTVTQKHNCMYLLLPPKEVRDTYLLKYDCTAFVILCVCALSIKLQVSLV